jgi:hypothetical protein
MVVLLMLAILLAATIGNSLAAIMTGTTRLGGISHQDIAPPDTHGSFPLCKFIIERPGMTVDRFPKQLGCV